MTPPSLNLPAIPSIPSVGELHLTLPEDLVLPALDKIEGDPELLEMAALESWRRILAYHWQQRMHALWERGTPGDKQRLTEITGMSRGGARRRGSQSYDKAMKDARRRQPPTRDGDTP